MYDSFHDAKVGDKVLLHDNGGMGEIRITKCAITRITKKYVVLHMVYKQNGKIYNEYDNLYRKDTGELRGADTWSTNYITHLIEEDKDAKT